MGVAENNVVNRVMIHASTLKGRLFRNNVGSAKAADGRYIEFGLCKGSTDSIGGLPVKITPEMVGKILLVFAAVESKTPTAFKKKNNNLSPEQVRFISFIKSMGGFACCVDSEYKMEELYKEFLSGLES